MIVKYALAIRRIKEIIDLISSVTKSQNHVMIEDIAPTVCYIYLCHSILINNMVYH